jgi:hypothetical protein
MNDMKYLDFDLAIEPLGDGYTARVFDSPSGPATAQFRTPFSDLEIENFLLRLGRTRHMVRRMESPEMASAKAFGAHLFNGVFTGDVRGCLRSSLDEANRQGAGLRVRLHLTKTPALADLPWEFLYNENMNRFFGLSVETPLVRYLDLPERIRPLGVTPPLRVLMMISSPTDYPALDVRRESTKMTEALACLEQRGLVVVEQLEQATLSELQRRLRQGQYHIFHFIGHGGFDKQADDGILVLTDAEGRGRRVSAQFLGTLLHDHRPLRLAVLNACEGARASRRDPFAGTAQSLVQQGIPAVIAMQFEVTDEAAICFTREFYASIASGYPVDAALAESRKAIFAEVSEIEWGTPVLYMRAPDGRIFEIERVSDAEREQSLIASLLSAARTAAASGDDAEEEAALKKVLALKADNAAASARLDELSRRRAEAAERAKRIETLRQGAATAQADRRWADAVSHLEALVAAQPNDGAARAQLAEARWQTELGAQYMRGRARLDSRQWALALQDFRDLNDKAAGYRDVATLITIAEAQLHHASGPGATPPPKTPATPKTAAGAPTSRMPVKYLVIGLAIAGVLVVAAVGLTGLVAVVFDAGRSSVRRGTDGASIANAAGLNPPPTPATVTPELRARLVAAINRGDAAEMIAYRTLNPSGLSTIYSGDELARHSGEIANLTRNGVYAVNQIHNQRFESFSIDPDGRRAEVRLTENWSSDFHSVLTQACVSHIHQHDIPQTAFLELTPQGWMIYASRSESPMPPLAACH